MNGSVECNQNARKLVNLVRFKCSFLLSLRLLAFTTIPKNTLDAYVNQTFAISNSFNLIVAKLIMVNSIGLRYILIHFESTTFTQSHNLVRKSLFNWSIGCGNASEDLSIHEK